MWLLLSNPYIQRKREKEESSDKQARVFYVAALFLLLFTGHSRFWLFRRIKNLDTWRESREVLWAWAEGGFLVKQGVPVKDIPPAGLPLCAGQDYGKNLYPNSVQKKEFLEEFLCF